MITSDQSSWAKRRTFGGGQFSTTVDGGVQVTEEWPLLILDGIIYALKQRSNPGRMLNIATRLLEHWAVNDTPNLCRPVEYWKSKRCIDKQLHLQVKDLGVILWVEIVLSTLIICSHGSRTTTTQNYDGNCILPFVGAQAIACLLTEREKKTSHFTLELDFIFLSRYWTPWPSYGPFQARKLEYQRVREFTPTSVRQIFSGELRFQLHMRSFTPGRLSMHDSAVEGIICDRLCIEIHGPSGSADFSVVECRRSVDIRCLISVFHTAVHISRVVDNSVYEGEEIEQNLSAY